MYVGLALYNVVDTPSTDMGWTQKNTNLKDQVIEAVGKGCSGYSLFRYDYMTRSAAAQELANLKGGTNDSKDWNINYRTHVQTYGWQGWTGDGQTSGTEGQSKKA